MDSWRSSGTLAILGGVLWLLLVGFGLRSVALGRRSDRGGGAGSDVFGARSRGSGRDYRVHVRLTHARPRQSRAHRLEALCGRRGGRRYVSATDTRRSRRLGMATRADRLHHRVRGVDGVCCSESPVPGPSSLEPVAVVDRAHPSGGCSLARAERLGSGNRGWPLRRCMAPIGLRRPARRRCDSLTARGASDRR